MGMPERSGFLDPGDGQEFPGQTPAPTYAPPDSTNIPDSSDFEIEDGHLYSYKGSETCVTIPDTVTGIGMRAFDGCTNLRAVIIPAGVKEMEQTVFYDCPYLRYIIFEGNTTLMGAPVYKCVRFTNISAGKNTKPYQYAKKNGIPVVVKKNETLKVSKYTMLAGDLKKNTVYNNYRSVQWKSSKSKVLSVSSSGKMKGLRAGKSTVTAQVNGRTLTCQVTVKKRTLKNRIHMVNRDIITKKMTTYQKIRTIHNWMIANVKYDYDAYRSGLVPPLSHSARGALLKGIAVCDGYAYAFRMFMKSLHIPCRVVIGRSGPIGHGWNMVKVGGKWYHIDVTFDDPIVNNSNANKKPYYRYFLKSSRVMRRDHQWKASRYPKCTSRKYD